MWHLTKQEKPWSIHIGESHGVAIVEITDPPVARKKYRDFYVDLAHHALENCRMVALSQWIDEDQGWHIEDRMAYVATLREKFSVRAELTTYYDDSSMPEFTTNSYVIHVMGQPNHLLLESILEFGGTSLSNIAYGIEHAPQLWPQAILSHNRAFVRWFQLAETDEVIACLVERACLLFWTIDEHLWLGLRDVGKMDKVLEVIEAQAKEWHLPPAMKHQLAMRKQSGKR